MAANVKAPIIFPLSNPTSKAECTAENAYSWTGGRCIFASGSPFDPVTVSGKTFKPSQCNNMFIFPGVGLGVLLAKAKIVTDDMFYVAAKALATALTDSEREAGMCFPSVSRIRHISACVASAGESQGSDPVTAAVRFTCVFHWHLSTPKMAP